jgi:hypothetical protein
VAALADVPEVVNELENRDAKHVVVSDDQTLVSRPGPRRVMLDYLKLFPMPRGPCLRGEQS